MMKHPTAVAKSNRFNMDTLCTIVFASVVVLLSGSAFAQHAAVCGGGYRVIAHRWDPVLRMSWEMRQDCAHPDWPARLASVASIAAGPIAVGSLVMPTDQAPAVEPLLVRAGDQVRLWLVDGPVRIEMSGVAEQSARNGTHVIVKITRQSDDAGLTVRRIPGIVRGAGDVEMER
jgi:hypothetical protein